MKCPNCKSFVTTTVCPECQAPLKHRAGLQIPSTDTLVELNYGVGKNYVRYYRIALLRAEGNYPPKLAFGCEERPLAFLSGKQSWFNPVMITPETLDVLANINTSQLASAIAFCTFLKDADRIDHAYYRFYKAIASPPIRKFLWDEAVRFLRIMQH
jgi:hypothetical protein